MPNVPRHQQNSDRGRGSNVAFLINIQHDTEGAPCRTPANTPVTPVIQSVNSYEIELKMMLSVVTLLTTAQFPPNAFRFHQAYSDNMILQRSPSAASISGWSNPGNIRRQMHHILYIFCYTFYICVKLPNRSIPFPLHY